MDQLLLDRLNEAIENNLQNEQFGVPEIAMAAGLSKSQLNRKLHDLTGQSSSQFIREYRLNKAKELLQNNSSTASEVAYRVGFSSPAYFSTCFKDFYGYPPSEVKYREDTTNPSKVRSTGWKILFASLAVFIIATIAFISFHTNNSTVEEKTDRIILEKSIAILPFKNLSNNQEDQILADAVMEHILKHLQRIPISDISLRSRTSTEQYLNSTKSIIEIGNELKVNYILIGSFQKIGDQANLAVQLINATTDDQVWAQEYSRNWSDIFKVQTEVANKVADKLSATFTKTAKEAIEINPTINMEAYEHYLKGLIAFRSWWNGDTTFLNLSEQLFTKALELDNNFSYAYTGLAKVYMQYTSIRYESRKEILRRAARNYLEQAIKLDPYNGWAYSELGVLQEQWQWDSIAARKNFNTALRLEPNNYVIIDSYFEFEYSLGNCKKIERLLQSMIRFDPYVSNPYHGKQLKLLKCQNNHLEIANIADEYGNYNYRVTQLRLFFYGYLNTKNYRKAREMANYIKEKSRRNWQVFRLFGILNASEGKSTLAYAYADSLSQLSTKEYVPKVIIASLYAVIRDKDNMYRNLDLALSIGEKEIHNIMKMNDFIPYQKEARFQEIWAKAWIPRNVEESPL